MKRLHKQAEGLSESSRWSEPGGDHRGTEQVRSTPKGVPEHSEIDALYDPFRVGMLSVCDRWCRSAQPPATVWQPFGLRQRCESNPLSISMNLVLIMDGVTLRILVLIRVAGLLVKIY